MFSWICARCGRDNPPSVTNCLSCGTRFDAPEVDPEPPAAVVHEPVREAPVRETPVYQDVPAFARTPTYAAPEAPRTEAPRMDAPRTQTPPRPVAPAYAEVPKAGLPTWLLTILFFFAIVGAGAAIYYGIQYFRSGKAATSTGLDPAANNARTKLSNPLQKYVEVVGIRLVEGSRRKPEARFVVINHSATEIDDLNATVTLWASTSRSEEDSVGTFTFKVSSLPGFESKEFTAPLNTKLKMYELPDWQNATPEVQITSP